MKKAMLGFEKKFSSCLFFILYSRTLNDELLKKKKNSNLIEKILSFIQINQLFFFHTLIAIFLDVAVFPLQTIESRIKAMKVWNITFRIDLITSKARIITALFLSPLYLDIIFDIIDVFSCILPNICHRWPNLLRKFLIRHLNVNQCKSIIVHII